MNFPVTWNATNKTNDFSFLRCFFLKTWRKILEFIRVGDLGLGFCFYFLIVLHLNMQISKYVSNIFPVIIHTKTLFGLVLVLSDRVLPRLVWNS
jgi:hypothetical protein